MQFLKTLFWVVIAVSIAIFANRNWRDVTVDLWGPLQADIKLPVLMGMCFLIGFIPVWLVMRGRLWTVRRRLAHFERPLVNPPAAEPAPRPVEARPE
jgi:uncharacterized membrane protein YciS (DUF1049 family)